MRRRCEVAIAAGLVSMIALAGGCGGAVMYQTSDRTCIDAGARLAAAIGRLEELRAAPEPCSTEKDAADCRQQRAAIEHLAAVCPAHVPTLLANAVLAYGEGRSVLAQQYLDALFAVQASQPEAATLRVRLALESGNVSFALRFSADQIALSPAYGPLHELRASALFAAGRFDDAGVELTIAEKLGVPAWRVAYNRGLIAEKTGDLPEAAKQYQAALDARPGWTAASDRLKAIRSK